MDPSAAIVTCLFGDRDQKREAKAALSGWYAARGYRPMITDVAHDVWRALGRFMTKTEIAKARKLGARGTLAPEYDKG